MIEIIFTHRLKFGCTAKVKYLLATVAILSLGQAALSQESVTSDQANKNAFIDQSEFVALKGAREVAVVFELPYKEHFSGLSEDVLRKIGCTFVARNKIEIEELANIIKNNLVKPDEIDEIKDPNRLQGDNWEGVFFKLQNGTEEKFLFEEPSPSYQMLIGSFNHRRIVVRPSLVRNLYKWAAWVDASSSDMVNDFTSGDSLDVPGKTHSDQCRSFVKNF